MSKATITVEAFVANDLSVRYAGGHRVVDVSLPHTPQKRTADGRWEDSGPTTWYQVSFWDEHADAVLDSVQKSSLVTVTGVPELEVYVKNDGTAGGRVAIKFPVLGVVVRKPRSGTPPVADEVWSQPESTGNDGVPF